MNDHFLQGALLASATSLFWSFAPFFFASAGKKLGPYYLNLWRLAIASILLFLVVGITVLVNGSSLGITTIATVGWLFLSGIIGLIIGDWFYFKSLTIMGPRQTLQTLSFAPVFAVIIAWVWLDERLTMYAILGIVLAVTALCILSNHDRGNINTAEPGRFSLFGYLLAICAAFFQGSATVIVRYAYHTDPTLNTISATAIRIGSAGVALWIYACIRGECALAVNKLKSTKAFPQVAAGATMGPVAGMLCYISSLKFAPAGIVSILTSLSPLLIIFITSIRYKTPINRFAIIAMSIATLGIILIFWH